MKQGTKDLIQCKDYPHLVQVILREHKHPGILRRLQRAERQLEKLRNDAMP